MINMLSQPINSSILKNQYQVRQGTHMNKKKLNINLVQYLWLDLIQEKIDQVLSLCIGYLWKQLDHMKKVFKE
jgi:predicted DNA-binding protein (MmcQ/YjbR family)